MRTLIRWLFALCLLAPNFARAHGGEDHGDKAAVPLSESHGAVASATGSVFEAVLKVPTIALGEESMVRLLVSDFASNAPVKEASIDLEIKSASARIFSGKAKATQTEGVYEVSVTFPSEGTYSADLTIQAHGRADLLVVSGLTIKQPEAAATSNALALKSPTLIIGGVFLFAIVLGFALGRRSVKRAAPITPKEAA